MRVENKQLKNTSCFDRSKLTQKQNLEELMRLTLINILNAKGLYYRKYQLQYQQKHQSYPIDYLPMKF